MSFNPSLTRDPGLIYHDTTGVDLINFAGNLSFELCKFSEEWSNILNRAKYSGMLLFFGAGGAYILWSWKSKGGSSSSPSSRPNFLDRSFWKWLLGEELVEGEDNNIDHVHGYYFGPSLSVNDNLGSPNDADQEMDSDNLSLNSLSATSSPYKFFQRPLSKANNQMMKNLVSVRQKILNPCPKCEKGICRLKKHQRRKNYSSSSSCYSDSPKAQKRRTSSIDTLKYDDDKIIQRSVAFNTLTHRIYKPGLDLRMRGDGSEETSVPVSNIENRSNDYDAIKSCLPSCGDMNCTEPTCYLKYPLNRDWSIDSIGDSLGTSMLELVRNAKETRRLIRDISMDSEASDIEILYEQSALDSIDFSECDPLEFPASEEFNIDEELPKNQLRERDFWRLTGFNEGGSDNMESSDIESQSLEWDSTPGWCINSKNESIIHRKNSSICLNELPSFDETNLDGYEWDDNGIDEIAEDFSDHARNANGLTFSMSNFIGNYGQVKSINNFQVSDTFFHKDDQTSIAKELPRSRELLQKNAKMYSDEYVLSDQSCPNFDNKEFPSVWPTLSKNDGKIIRSVTSYSDESGFLDGDSNMNISNYSTSSMNSSIFTNSIDLSPVKEMREPQVLRNRRKLMDQIGRSDHISTSSAKD